MFQNRLNFLLTFLFASLAILLLIGALMHLIKIHESLEEYVYLFWLILGMMLLAYLGFVLVRYVFAPFQVFKERLKQLSEGKKMRTYSDRKSGLFYFPNQYINQIEKNIQQMNEYTKNKIDLKADDDQKPIYIDEILLEKLTNLQETITDNQNEAKWMRVLTEFSHLLRNNTNQTLEQTLRNFLNYLLKFFSGQQGAIYIYDEQNKDDLHLKLFVSYAYSETRYKKDRFELNEGLIGECWQHNKIIKIEDVPTTYTKIASGLGESQAKTLLLMPVVFRNSVLGVIEILSFESYDEYKIDLIQNIARNLGIALENYRNIRQ
ncbi:MAG: GAF domain-containing protein [Bacteroidetes bacterium]|nr:MAG: GAF domain-containing protein [Bacteroidota bacterium]TAG89461.1 MAG: GAF domain-containing protein [Bacteroidota bacterium]